MDIKDVGSIKLDISVFNDMKIQIFSKDNKLIKTIPVNQDNYWQVYLKIVQMYDKEKNK